MPRDSEKFRKLNSNRLQLKSITILYDKSDEWWLKQLSLGHEFKTKQFIVFDGTVPDAPDGATRNDILVFDPCHSDGYSCDFSGTLAISIKRAVLTAFAKGWKRVHIHACHTAVGVCDLDVEGNALDGMLLSGFTSFFLLKETR